MYLAFGKRWLDVILSAMLLIFFGVLIINVILMYCLIFQFPVFFMQQRIGWNGEIFTLYKLRTLNVSHDLDVRSRRFLLGDLLRATSLDELPQIWNVLKGEMSLVGPRPLPTEYMNLFSKEQFRRHAVRPGITGWAQVNGRHSILWQKKFELDNYYVDHVSFKLDVTILLKTIVLLLSFKKDRSLKEEKFQGN